MGMNFHSYPTATNIQDEQYCYILQQYEAPSKIKKESAHHGERFTIPHTTSGGIEE